MPNNNPKGRGGFAKHPENRHTDGSKNKHPLIIKIEEYLEKQSVDIVGEKEKTYADDLISAVVQDGIDNDGQSRKLLMQYIIGMPKQMLELSGRLDIDKTARMRASEMTDEEFKAYLQKHIDGIDRKASDSK